MPFAVIANPLVVLDPGHGGIDPGASGCGMVEKVFVLAFTLMVGERLKRNGVRVAYTRTEDSAVSLSRRAQIADQLGAHYFASWHLNSNAGTPGTGMESYVQIGQAGKDTDFKRLAVHNELAAVAKKWGLRVRGAFEKDLAVTRETSMPAALFELAFTNNEFDVSLLRNTQFVNEYADAAARGICRSLGREYDQGQISLTDAVQTLVGTGVIREQSHTYWLENAVAGKTVKGEYAGLLIMGYAKTDSLTEAANLLAQWGVSASPAYWTSTAKYGQLVDGKYAALLIKQMALHSKRG